MIVVKLSNWQNLSEVNKIEKMK